LAFVYSARNSANLLAKSITLTMILEVGQRMIMYSVMTVRLYT